MPPDTSTRDPALMLRRLATAFRRQDWATVAIEFVVVVAGVVVALQADNWNERRIERNRERMALERLLDESRETILYIGREFAWGETNLAAQREFLDVIFSAAPVPADTGNAQTGFFTLNMFPAMAPPRTTHDELASTGDIRLIRSVDVRRSIADYYARLDWYLAQLSYFRDFSIAPGNDARVEATQYMIASFDPEHDRGGTYAFDWLGMRRDQAFRNLLVAKYRNQVVMNANRASLLESAQAMCEVLALELGHESPREPGGECADAPQLSRTSAEDS